MIDPNKPIRIRGGHGRARIVGNDGMGNHHVRYHDGQWRTTTIDGATGWQTSGGGIAFENYEIDWNAHLAFQDDGERCWLSHFSAPPAGEVMRGVSDRDGTVYWYDEAGMQQHTGVQPARPIMNVRTGSVEQDEAKDRVAQKRAARQAEIEAERELAESNPLWGIF